MTTTPSAAGGGGHTPGEWYAEPPNDQRDDFYAQYFWSIRFRDARGLGAEVARITSLNTRHEEANAHLIAAAPELLSALTAILDHCDGYVPDTSKAIWRDAHAAIAKATGRAATGASQ